eukprot:COSAG06_NODE_54573_length_294_cov_0.471795_1_plen_63_part_01
MTVDGKKGEERGTVYTIGYEGVLGWTALALCASYEKNGIFEIFKFKMTVLPRQARDKHRENSK